MQPTTTYDDKLLDNLDKFQDPFFRALTLRPHALQLDEKISKTYQFPTCYSDVTVAIGIFMCSQKAAQKMMLHPKIKPVTVKSGRSLVIFSCYEYKNVMGIPPYNEIAMTIPILVDPKLNIPLLPMVMDKMFKEFGYYVFSMPVTSLENRIRGNRIWGLPKVVRRIDIEEKGGICATTCHEESGEPYFHLEVPTEGKPKEFDVASNLYTRLGDELLQSETKFKATFAMNVFFNQLFKSTKPDREYLRIENTPSGKLLRELDIDPHPFQFRFARHMTACFDLPNKGFKSPIKF